MDKVHFSSERQDWATPQSIFDEISAKHGPFDLDVCAAEDNDKCEVFFDPITDGLSPLNPWIGNCWMNPPYGRNIKQWVRKAVFSVKFGEAIKVVCLLPARTDTRWWHDYVIPYGKVEFYKGRIRFEGAIHSAPFPSAIVVFEK